MIIYFHIYMYIKLDSKSNIFCGHWTMSTGIIRPHHFVLSALDNEYSYHLTTSLCFVGSKSHAPYTTSQNQILGRKIWSPFWQFLPSPSRVLHSVCQSDQTVLWCSQGHCVVSWTLLSVPSVSAMSQSHFLLPEYVPKYVRLTWTTPNDYGKTFLHAPYKIPHTWSEEGTDAWYQQNKTFPSESYF